MKSILSILILCAAFISVNAQTYTNYAAGKELKASWKAKNIHFATDENLSTGRIWCNKGKFTFEIDLTAEFEIGGVQLYFESSGLQAPNDFIVQYNNGKEWVDIKEAKVEKNYSYSHNLSFDNAYSATAIRVMGESKGAFGIKEIAIWGTDFPELKYGMKFKAPEVFKPKKHWICVNQVAYNLNQPKRFTVPTAKSDLHYTIVELGSGQVVYEGHLKNKLGDFSDFNPSDSKGKVYSIQLEGDKFPMASSYPFWIGEHMIQETAYRSAVDFFIDVRSMIGTHYSAYGGSAWRDGTYYTYEVPSMVMMYLATPEVFKNMEVTLDWDAEKKLVLSDKYKPYHKSQPNDKYALQTLKKIYGDIPSPAKDAPDLVKCILFGTAWDFIQPVQGDPSGDPLKWHMSSQTIEKFAYFLYGYPKMKEYISKDFYNQVLDSTQVWWKESGLFDVITKVGSGKGRHCVGHSIMPNLFMYEVAKRENLKSAKKYLKAAKAQTEWIIENVDWNDPVYTKGQRISEHKLVTGLTHFLKLYPKEAPEGLKEKVEAYTDKVIELSDNEWDFRRFDLNENWTLASYNEAGNVIGFPACAFSVALCMDDSAKKDRLIEIAFAHIDNYSGRNPANAHCANHPNLGFIGIDRGWPHGDKRRNICARLENVRGSLSSLPGTEMYPFNPTGKPRWGEGWTVYNALWNITLTYLNFYEGVSSIEVFREN